MHFTFVPPSSAWMCIMWPRHTAVSFLLKCMSTELLVVRNSTILSSYFSETEHLSLFSHLIPILNLFDTVALGSHEKHLSSFFSLPFLSVGGMEMSLSFLLSYSVKHETDACTSIKIVLSFFCKNVHFSVKRITAHSQKKYQYKCEME